MNEFPQRPLRRTATASEGRLTARPCTPSGTTTGSGVETLIVEGQAAGLLSVPSGYEQRNKPAWPLLVLLHGAGGTARQAWDLVSGLPQARDVLVLAPQSSTGTWDVIAGGFGPDVVRIDAMLAQVYDRIPVADTAIGGFSDGASYALTLGLINGDLFSTVLAYSPGFAAARSATGRPRIYVGHGIYDQVLPVDRCSRRLVPALRHEGYDVTYTEFDGPHVVPPDIAAEGLALFLGTSVSVPESTRAAQPGM